MASLPATVQPPPDAAATTRTGRWRPPPRSRGVVLLMGLLPLLRATLMAGPSLGAGRGPTRRAQGASARGADGAAAARVAKALAGAHAGRAA
eukprot:scaffold4369_cov336-Prasinococcus_capsulatus_cf.AAC.1